MPSINTVGSNKKAILSGDYLLAKVIRDLCLLGNHDALRELSLVIQDLSIGEWLQMEVSHCADKIPTPATIDEIILKKTSSMIAWSCLTPPLIAGANSQCIESCREFGTTIGKIFQLTDDLLDFSPFFHTSESGKDTLLDLKNKTLNSVLFMHFQKYPDDWSRWLHGSFVTDIESEDPKSRTLYKNLLESVKLIKDRSELLVNKAEQLLDQIAIELSKSTNKKVIDSPSFKAIKLLIQYLPVRTK
jgi:geranylgeranyl pyrophosphate synthase